MRKTTEESTEKGTRTTRMTRTIPATPLSATVKALQTGTPMRPRGRTAMRAATAKTEEKRLRCMREMMENCMRGRRKVCMRMRR